MNLKKYVLIVIALLALIAIIVFFLRKGPSEAGTSEDSVGHRGITGDPTDITFDFYASWVAKRKETEVGATAENPIDAMVLSLSMQEKLRDFNFSNPGTEVDPVLCQTDIPESFRTRSIFRNETAAQLLVLSSDKQAGRQAVVTLEEHDGLWEISDITCGMGEQGPEQGEFSFDNEGFLLKSSLPSNFNTDFWHIVFRQDGTDGHTAPLILGNQSMCTIHGNEEACSSDGFSETMRVHVQGQMTEAGVDVKKVEILE